MEYFKDSLKVYSWLMIELVKQGVQTGEALIIVFISIGSLELD